MSEFLAYAGLLSTASACVYVGSYTAMHTPMKTRELRKEAGMDVNQDEEEGQSQSLSSENAYIFPVIGSAALLSLYLAFKYFDKRVINLLLNFYFAVAGAFAIPSVIEHLSKVVRGGTEAYLEPLTIHLQVVPRSQLVLRLRLPCPTRWALERSVKTVGAAPPITDVHSPPTAATHTHTVDLLGFVVMGLYLYTRSWWATNVVAVSFAVQGIMLITLDSFKTGFILLAGLFFYDIFWVFGSARLVKSGPSVMVSVATNFDGPIKILCPKNLVQIAQAWSQSKAVPKLAFALLGLGDIVIPGVFVALALRFDQLHASNKQPGLHFTRFFRDFPKPYFTACLTAYVGGLMTTMAVMHLFGAAQPALLYLSPACALSVVAVALQRGELHELWGWEDRTIEPSPVEKSKAA